MKKTILSLTGAFLLLFLISVIGYELSGSDFVLPIAITLGTICYHFVMRLLVGAVFDATMHNKADYTKKWFSIHKWETTLYKKLKVKKWKDKMPTFDESLFDSSIHSLKEIVGAMCQAELVHETIAVLSFLPIVAGRWFGAYPVFIITSIVAALFDLTFVMMQRFNRPRVIRILEKSQNY